MAEHENLFRRIFSIKPMYKKILKIKKTFINQKKKYFAVS